MKKRSNSIKKPEERETAIVRHEEACSRESNFYRRQCAVLQAQLSDAEGIIAKHSARGSADGAGSASGGGGVAWPKRALMELRRTLKIGQALIVSCQDEPCFKAYLRWGEKTRALAEALREIIWCMSVGFYYSTRYFQGNPAMDIAEFPVPELGAYKELHMVQIATSEDKEELLESLDAWIENHRCSAQECGGDPKRDCTEDPPLCIAAQILKKRKKEKKRGDSPCVEKYSEVDHTSVLLNINSKALEDGKLIGAGAYCSVVETTWLGNKYAKKNFSLDSPVMFRDEANALSKLTHPHMVAVSAYSVHVDSESQTSSLLMERMPYDLRQYMTKRYKEGFNPPFSIAAAVDLMLQGAEAMRYMHSERMVHRDLKPPNFLVKPVDIDDPGLRKQGFVIAKLGDFGLAKLKNEVTSYSHLTKNQGTRKYMAPEVFKLADKHSAENVEHALFAFPMKADVFSFGIVCSEILTGMVPYENVTFRLSKLHDLLTNEDYQLRPELPETCPKSLASLICQCWDTDPKKRPTFTEISTTLRYLKGLLMLTDDDELHNWMVTPCKSHIVRGTQTSNPGPLYYTFYDGSSWKTPVRLPHGMASPSGMSLAEHHGTLVGIHRSHGGNLYCSSYNGVSWTLPHKIEQYQSDSLPWGAADSRPAVARFQDRLFCVYRCTNDKICCTHSMGSYMYLDNLTWKTPYNAGGGSRTIDGPALASFNKRLICVIRSANNRTYWSSYNGSAWSRYEALDKHSQFKTSASPALAEYNGELYCFLRGMDQMTAGGLFWSKLSKDGRSWSRFSKIERIDLLSGPSFAVYRDKLVCTLRGGGNQLWCGTTNVHSMPFESLDSPLVAEVIPVDSQYCLGEQGLCAVDSKLFCVYGASKEPHCVT